jgi:hypothetical protein
MTSREGQDRHSAEVRELSRRAAAHDAPLSRQTGVVALSSPRACRRSISSRVDGSTASPSDPDIPGPADAPAPQGAGAPPRAPRLPRSPDCILSKSLRAPLGGREFFLHRRACPRRLALCGTWFPRRSRRLWTRDSGLSRPRQAHCRRKKRHARRFSSTGQVKKAPALPHFVPTSALPTPPLPKKAACEARFDSRSSEKSAHAGTSRASAAASSDSAGP